MSSAPARVLLVEDSLADAELILHELAREDLVAVAHRVDTIEDLQAALAETWDIVISDDALPGFGAAQTLELVAATDPTLPVIVVSGVLDEEAAVTHLRSGAKDFVTKSRLSRLNAAVRRELGAAELVKAKHAGERAAAELAAIVASSSDAIYSTDLSGEITSWNAAATRVFGHTAAELVGSATDPTVAHADRGRHTALCARAAAGELPPAHEVVRIAKDGTLVDTQVSIAAIRDGLGTVVGISTSARDVTDQKQAARRLEEHDRAFEAIFEGAYDAMLIADDAGKFLGANRAAGALLGLPPEALLGREVEEFVELDAAGQFAEFLTAGELTGTIALRCADGAVKLAEYSAAANILPGRHLSILRDVTERIEAERVHRESEAKFRAVFDYTRSAILLFDDDQTWLEGNAAAGRLFGLPGEELAGRRFSDFKEPGAELDDPFANVVEVGELEGDWTVVRPDGERRLTEYSLRANIAPGLHLAVIRDATVAHGLEEQLRQAQKLEAVGLLAGGIAHDFNNLLTAISGYSDLALDQLDSGGPGARASVEEIRRAGERAAQLTHQLLAFSRRQVLKQEPLDLNVVVGEYMPMLTRILGEQITVDLALGAEPLTVLGDRGQLGQVIINLAVNARDAMPDGGTLTFRTLLGDADRRSALLEVTDTGTGIDPVTRVRLFEPFFTTKPVGQGTGLGLATVLGIVEQSGGTVAVESQPGAGTTFTIALPCVEDAVSATATRPAGRDPNGSETILVVEDDASLGEMIKRMLEARGYAITVASTPVEALALSAAAAEGAFELLVTDVVMPEMNGRQLAELLLADRPDLRVLYTSGYSEDDLLARGVIDGSASFLPKPFSFDQLAREVRRRLDDPRALAAPNR